MKNLESQVRDALINQRAEELYESVLDNKEYKNMVISYSDKVVDVLFNSILDTNKNLEFNEKELEEINQSKKEIKLQIYNKFNNPERLKEMLHGQAKQFYESSSQIKEMLNEQVEDIKSNSEIDEKTISNYLRAYESMFGFVEVKDNLVKRLVEIAEKTNIQEATKKETVYKVTREFFPTPESYREHSKKSLRVIISLFKNASNSLMMDGEEGKFAGDLFEEIGNLLEDNSDIMEKSQEKYLEEAIKNIYSKE